MSYGRENQKPKTILVGNRIPKRFFITKGKGESDLAVHAGSYHLALKQAEIERCNVMTYSSILPKIATEIEKTPGVINSLTHGAELNTIMACSTAEKGKRATAGIIFGWLYDKKTGEKYGGLVCEYNGDLPEEEAKELLHANLNELYTNGYSEEFELRQGKLVTKSFVPEKRYGTILVALCFIDYEMPIIEEKENILEEAAMLEVISSQ
ncbi:pyruvoyl-dependent arginine decarboxylase [Candidatus Woesearchaeota archaeon]|nr:pyruvoyl-dependent arginine decarboxylase [Candidatus Woesearchaeota archaeon]